MNLIVRFFLVGSPGFSKHDRERESEGFVFLVRTFVNRLLDGTIIFETKTTFLQAQHIVQDLVLMFTNRLSGIISVRK